MSLDKSMTIYKLYKDNQIIEYNTFKLATENIVVVTPTSNGLDEGWYRMSAESAREHWEKSVANGFNAIQPKAPHDDWLKYATDTVKAQKNIVANQFSWSTNYGVTIKPNPLAVISLTCIA